MPLTEADAARLEGLGHARAAFSIVDDATGELRLRNVDDGAGRACFFLRGGRCSAYADRPAGCRTYPFVLDVGDRLARDEECPHRAEFVAAPGTRRRLATLVRAVDRESAHRRE
jgi:Fe-S-cluster containining protein